MAKKHSTGTPAWLVILLSIIIPPISWYFMYTEKKYNSWFSVGLWINAAVFIGVAITQEFMVIPKLAQLYQSLSLPYEYTPFHILLASAILYAVAATFVGFALKKRIHQPKSTYQHLMVISMVLLIVQPILVAIAVFVFLQYSLFPLYSLGR